MDTELLIREVKKRWCLWDVRCKEYRNRAILRDAWAEIAKIMNIDDLEAVKRKWKCLRDNYRSELSKINRTTGYTSKWCHFHDLDFLRDFVTPSKPPTGILNESLKIQTDEGSQHDKHLEKDFEYPIASRLLEESQKYFEFNTNFVDSEDSSRTPATNSRSKTVLKRKLRDEECKFLEIEKEKLALLKDEQTLNRDDNFHFLMSMLPHMRDMTVTKNLRFRMQLSKLLFELVASEDSS